MPNYICRLLFVLLIAVGALSAQKNSKTTEETTAFTARPIKVPYNVLLNTDKPFTVDVVIDMSGYSPFKAARSVEVLADFYQGKKFLFQQKLEFGMTILPGGKKYVKSVNIKPEFLKKVGTNLTGLRVVGRSINGFVDTSVVAWQASNITPIV